MQSQGFGSMSITLTPTFGIEGFVNGSAAGADLSLQPVAFRAILSSLHTMAELRLAGHFLYGGQVDSFAGSDSLGRTSSAGTLGLQFVIAPMLFKRAMAREDHRVETNKLPPAKRRPARAPDDQDDEEDDRPRKKRKHDDEDARAPREVRPTPGTFTAVSERGAAL
jgi:hypothetical protein